MKNKKIVIALIALVAVVGLMLGIWTATRPQTNTQTKTITVTVVHSDGAEKNFTYVTDAGKLSEVLLAEGLVTGYASEQYGFTIESVDGVSADWATDGAYWALYVGDEYAITSAAGIELTDGGVYRLVYEKF